MTEKTKDQEWCLHQAEKANNLNAPTVEALLRDAAEHPDKARICREEMSRASKAVSRIRGS
jgi:hypothetical protein